MSARKYTPLALAAGLVLILFLAAGAGAVVLYPVLFPPVWSEQLPFKNSTGQYDVITQYRNSTDDTYENLTAFLSVEIPVLEDRVLAEETDRPVEYAVLLHDSAERRQINSSIIGTDILDQTPRHAVVAFHTTDRGMIYVDLTSRNVSASDYVGLDFSGVSLARKKWSAHVPYRNSSDSHPVATEYRDAVPVAYDRLTAFLAADSTEKVAYVDPEYTCLEFATAAHDRAEAQGIKCGIASVTFQGKETGHAFNAYPTTDRGIVYIDSTGFNQSRIDNGENATDNAVYLQEGKELGELPIVQIDGQLDYAFYLDRKERMAAYTLKWNEYSADLMLYNIEVDEYNREMEENDRYYATYKIDSDSYKAAVAEYNRQMNLHNEALSRYNAGDHSVTVPPAPTNLAGLQAWNSRLKATYDQYSKRWDELYAWRERLDSKKADLISRRYILTAAEEYRWITYRPPGIVEKIGTYWG